MVHMLMIVHIIVKLDVLDYTLQIQEFLNVCLYAKLLVYMLM